MTEKENFIDFLTGIKKSTGDKYKPSTIDTYARSIDLITDDINSHLNLNLASLYNIKDVTELSRLFKRLHSIPKIKRDEEIQRKRKTNAFKRYIEFREFEQGLTLDQNQADLPDEEESRTEGGKKVIISKVAERDPKLRKAAIRIHGTTCFGCAFNFKSKYGEIGEGFIEIHHIRLLSGTNMPIKTNPKTDLIPLCSNCHRIVHLKRNYVMTLEELRQIVNNAH